MAGQLDVGQAEIPIFVLAVLLDDRMIAENRAQEGHLIEKFVSELALVFARGCHRVLGLPRLHAEQISDLVLKNSGQPDWPAV